MARIVVIFSLCLLAACDVGELPRLMGDGGGDSGGNGCVDLVMPAPAGHHNPAMVQGCMSAANCHNSALGLGTGAPAYSYGGLLFKADKTTPYAGATVIVKLDTAEKKTTVSDNGEFFLVPGVAGLDPPVAGGMRASTKATACPTAPIAMGGTLGPGDGDCQKGGCHTAGTGQGVVYAP
jgi:hypothetical protein